MLAGLVTLWETWLLHACCHNPTGFDLSHDDWHRVLDVVRRRELLPLIDFAYQGFGDGLEEDAWAVRLFAGELPEVLVTSSSLRRTSACTATASARRSSARNAEKLTDVRSQLAFLARNLWSTSPAHGAEGRGDPRRQRVEGTLAGRGRRHALAHRQPAHRPGRSPRRTAWPSASPMSAATRMFYTGLSLAAGVRLRDEHAAYLVSSGRANVAGLDARRLDRLAQAIAQVCAD